MASAIFMVTSLFIHFFICNYYKKRIVYDRNIIKSLILYLIPFIGLIILLNFNKFSFDELDFEERKNLKLEKVYWLFYIIFFCMAFMLYMRNRGIYIESVLISAALITSALFIIYSLNKSVMFLKHFLLLLTLIFVVLAQYASIDDSLRFIVLLVSVFVVLGYEGKKLYFILPIPLFLYLISESVKMVKINGVISDDFNVFLVRNILIYIVFSFLIVVFKNQLYLSIKQEIMMKRLKEQQFSLEESAIMNERARIAREMHDTIGHTLTGAMVLLEAARQYVDNDKAKAAIERASKVTRQGFSEVKSVIKTLRSVQINDNSLSDSLKVLFEHTKRTFDVLIHCDLSKLDKEFANQLKFDIYRVIQESITNSVRHGRAKNIYIKFNRQDEGLRILIEDDGIGSKSVNLGYGLKGIKERIARYSGEVYFKPVKDKGFSTYILIPNI